MRRRNLASGCVMLAVLLPAGLSIAFPVVGSIVCGSDSVRSSPGSELLKNLKGFLSFTGKDSTDSEEALGQPNGHPGVSCDDTLSGDGESHSLGTSFTGPPHGPSGEREGAGSSSEPSLSSSCTNISGIWSDSENGILCCTVLGMTECEYVTGSSPISIYQNACSIEYAVCLSGYGCFPRTGTITGDSFQFSGIFAVPSDENMVFTTNTYSETGTVFGDLINKTGSGTASGLYYYEGYPYDFTCTVQSHANANRVTPGAAYLLRPSGTISTNLPTYTWGGVFKASSYLLWVEDSRGNQINTWYSASAAGCAKGGTCHVTPDIPVGGDVKWWIQTLNAYGYGPWSDGMEFTAPLLTPEKATLFSPSGSIATNLPTYTWGGVYKASSYLLWVKDSRGNAISKWYSASVAGCAGGAGTCSVTPDIPVGGDAKWWIETWNLYGYGPWSDSLAFTGPELPLPGKVTLVSPSGTITSNLPTYTWNADAHSTWYWLWVNDGSGSPISKWYSASAAGCEGGSGTCSATPGILAGGPSVWWILTWNSFSWGHWSDGMAFEAPVPTSPGKATLIGPSGPISTITPTYTWNAVPSSTWYYLWVNDSHGNRIKSWYPASEVGCAGGFGTCSVTSGTALASGSGTWWILTWNSLGLGPWSEGMGFDVASVSESSE